MHPALAEPVEIRRAYATVVATLSASDGEVDDAELDDLRKLCADLHLVDDDLGQVLDAARHASHERLVEHLRALRPTTLRFTVLTDLIVHGFADGRYSIDERKRVRGYAMVLGVTEEQLAQLEQKVVDRNAERRAERLVTDRDVPIVAPSPLPRWALLLPVVVASLVPVLLLAVLLPGGRADGLAWSAALARLGVGFGPAGGAVVVMGLATATWWLTARALAATLARSAPPTV